MKIDQKLFARLALAAGLLTGGIGFGAAALHAQDAPPPGDRRPPPAAADERGPKRGPRAERPAPPRPGPPRPEDEQPAQPVDDKAAPAAVKTATDAATALSAGPVWVQSGPRGDKHLHAALVSQGKVLALLEFNPADGSVMPRGPRPMPPLPPEPPTPPAPPAPDADGKPAPRPDGPPPHHTDAPPTPAPGDNPPAPPDADAPNAAAMTPEQIKARLPEILKGLSVGQGAEVMPREGFWKVPLIYQNRVVGELHISGDGKNMVEDFHAARDAAVFAR